MKKHSPSNKMMEGLVSSLTIASHMALSHVVRRRFIPAVVDNEVVKGCLLELVAVVEMCCVSFELAVVADNFGAALWAFLVFLIIIWRSKTWASVTACPYSLLEQYVEGSVKPSHALLKVVAQLAGAFISYRLMRQLWMLELTASHVGRGLECTADLRVSAMLGFFIECFLTCACCLVSRTLGQIKLKYSSAINSFFTVSMVLLAFDYSGGYFNPVLATGLKWSCHGHTNTEHILVYWAGSILGSMLSLRLWSLPSISINLVDRLRPKEE
ncbi:hypothetical protein Pcinc_011558 [Petrolisthes cinctipes]|uniref:Aquaporin n=1 Tax=Petrolisthes cinctipes TaxID=88211 RepID=A0AAE1G0M5_PETCI|nr:hypothetical protein Pcinc_011558 [Petrolisthes cinctipes]